MTSLEHSSQAESRASRARDSPGAPNWRRRKKLGNGYSLNPQWDPAAWDRAALLGSFWNSHPPRCFTFILTLKHRTEVP